MIRTLVKLQLKLAFLPLKVVVKVAQVVLGRGDRSGGPASVRSAPPPPVPPSDGSASPFDVQVDPGRILTRLAEGDEFVFVDVRQATELADGGMIEGALHIPTQDLPRRLGELDSERETIVYCAAGVRSLDAVMFMREKGFDNAWSLGGGLPHWQADGGVVIDLE